MSELPPTWDPKPGSESWYRHAQSGERGFLVRRDGKSYVKADRPNQEILRRLDENFVEEDATRALTPIHVAKVCFEADRALCHALGMMEKSRVEWAKLTDAQRAAWISSGPLRPVQRAVLYATLKQAMEPFCGSR